MNDTLVVFVLDKSGSMDHLTDATINGFNAFIEDQLSIPGDLYVSLVLFDGKVHQRFEAVKIADLPLMARSGVNAYSASGGTALYDAAGMAIENAQEWIKANPGSVASVKVAIWTDGHENASLHWQLDRLNALLHDRTEDGWEIIFLGSGGAAWTEGKNFAVDPALVVNYAANEFSTAGAYSGLSQSMANSRLTGASVASTLVSNTSGISVPNPQMAKIPPLAQPGLKPKLSDAGTGGAQS